MSSTDRTVWASGAARSRRGRAGALASSRLCAGNETSGNSVKTNPDQGDSNSIEANAARKIRTNAPNDAEKTAASRHSDVCRFFSRVVGFLYLALGLGLGQTTQAATSSADSNLTRLDTRSAPVPVTITGRVEDPSGAPLVGARVSAAVFQAVSGETQTGADGTYRLAGIAAHVVTLSASLPGRRTVSLAVALVPTTTRQNFVLAPAVQPYREELISGTPPVSYVSSPEAAEGSHLLVFDGNVFTSNLALLDKSKMLTVLTHGFHSDSQDWALPMAQEMQRQGITDVNIVAWDWQHAAKLQYPFSELKTPTQGIALGQALQATKLGKDYAQPVHFLGHSFGTLVNRYAVDYLRGVGTGTQARAQDPWPGFRPHLTLFDEAEIGHLLSPEDLAGLATQQNPAVRWLVELFVKANYGPEAVKWKLPIPEDRDAAVWIDNYIASAGRSFENTFNVCLQFAFFHSPALGGHSYPQQWYQRTVTNPTNSLAGFRRSEEMRRKDPVRSGDFPPGTPLTAGRLFHQSSALDDEHQLEPVPVYGLSECYFPVFEGAALGIANQLKVEAAILAKDIIIESVRVSKNAVVTSYNATADAATTAYDYVGEKASAGVFTVWHFLTQQRLRIDLFGQSNPAPESRASLHGTPLDSTAYGIVRLTVPAEADFFSFDYTVSGQAVEGVLIFGVGTSNLFSQLQSVVPRDERQTSPLFPVKTLGGGTNEFYFGLAETATTNVMVRVDGFRFYSLEAPRLSVRSASDAIVLSWPSTANGYLVESARSVLVTNWVTLPQQATLLAGQFSVTNVVSGEAEFFRLRRQ